MTANRNNRRSAVTLIEVLVAIFVMGIGLICLLTLFPLGAQQMAAAFKDERTAQAAINARTTAAIKNLRADKNVVAKYKDSGVGPPADDDGPSNPVFVDPVGEAVSPALGSNIARVKPIYATTLPNSRQFFSLLDDVTFQRNMGVPKKYGPNIERESLYTWAYLLQRPRLGDAAVANASVCVFQRRTKAGFEDKYSAVMNPLDNTITVSYAGNTPNILPGMWVLDGTIKAPNKFAYGNFYRITGVRDASASSLALDLQTPLLGYGGAPYSNGEAIVLPGLVEVFDLGPGR